MSPSLVLLTIAAIFSEQDTLGNCSQTTEVQESLSQWPLPCPINTATPLLRGGGFWEELGWVGAIQPNGSQTTWVCIPVLLLTSCWTLGKLT